MSIQQSNTTGKDFVEKLRRSLRRDGDFPASARVVSELKKLTAEPDTTANVITELILREPSLGTRVLHLVNSSFYKRAKPIMTISQAVVQIGMRPLSELCSGLVLLQKFAPRAREGGAFTSCLQQTVTTSLLASTIVKKIDQKKSKKKDDETGYLAGTFLELGTLLLAYYFPKVYDSALKRSESKGQDLSQSIMEITGLSPTQLSLEVIDELKLPEFYQSILRETESLKTENNVEQSVALSKALYAAHEISAVLANNQSKDILETTLAKLDKKFDFEGSILFDTVSSLSDSFKEQCISLELPLPDLPTYLRNYADGEVPIVQVISENDNSAEKEQDPFAHYVDEIREAVEGREPTSSIITSVMETLTWGLQFDRVILMLLDKGKKSLQGRMALGNIPNFQATSYTRPVGNEAGPYAPDAKALAESKVIFQGEPFFEDGWPIVVLPVGFDSKTIGIIYADRANSDQDEINTKEKAALSVLAELLDRSVSNNVRG